MGNGHAGSKGGCIWTSGSEAPAALAVSGTQPPGALFPSDPSCPAGYPTGAQARGWKHNPWGLRAQNCSIQFDCGLTLPDRGAAPNSAAATLQRQRLIFLLAVSKGGQKICLLKCCLGYQGWREGLSPCPRDPVKAKEMEPSWRGRGKRHGTIRCMAWT